LAGNWSTLRRYYELGHQAAVFLEVELSQADFLRLLANIKDFQDDLGEAQDLIERAIEIYQMHNDESKWILSVFRLGSIQTKIGKYEAARRNANEALAVARQIENDGLIVRMQCRLAKLDIVEGNHEAAETRLRQPVELYEQDTWISSWRYRLLGRVSFLKQDYASAVRFFRRSLEIAHKIHSQQEIAESRSCMAELELILGHTGQAQRMATEAIDIFTRLGMKRRSRETRALFEQTSEAER
jgi:tetratricopeptide (TPR) repeat protein